MRGVVLMLSLASSSVSIAEENELTLKAEVKASSSTNAGQATDSQAQELAPKTETSPVPTSGAASAAGQMNADQAQVAGSFIGQICKNGTNTRRVELTGSAPCEVHYKKESEQPGHDQVLWTSPNNQGYCVTKAKAFVEKLVSMGWVCSAS